MIGANRAFVRKLRRRRVATYFAYWRAVWARVGHLDGQRAIGTQYAPLSKHIRRGLAAYHMIRLAMFGAAYGLGVRVNPAASLERVALLFGETAGGPELKSDRP